MNEDDLQLIHQYLDGDLSEEEVEALEARIEKEPDLRRSLEEERLIRQGIEFHGLSVLKSELDKLEDSLPDLNQEEDKGRVLTMRFRYIAAAVLTLVAISTLVIINRKPSQSLQELARKYLDEPVVVNILRSEENELSVLDKAIKAYGAGDYTDAELAFDSLSKSGVLIDDELDRLNFYAALTVIQIREDYSEATKKLQTIQDKNDQVRWFLALIYLVNDQSAEARVQLEYIVNNPDRTNFYKQAEDVLKKFPDR